MSEDIKLLTPGRKTVSRRSIVGMIAGAGLLAASDTRPSQSPGTDHDITFESGVHAFQFGPYSLLGVDIGQQDYLYKEVDKRFKEGDLSAHLWPKEVTQRLRQYQPHLVSLDSLSLMDSPTQHWWKWLPGSPREMTGRDSVLILAGDPLYATSWYDVGTDQKLFSKEVRKSELAELYKLVALSFAEGITTPILGASLLGKAASEYLKKRQVRSSPGLDKAQEISRRQFLGTSAKAALGTGLLAVSAGRAAPVIQSYSTNSELTPLLNTLTELTRPVIARSGWWLDGRTAFDIAKTNDGMGLLKESDVIPNDAKASLVFGFPHTFESGPLLRDKQYRANVMREFAKHMIETIIKVDEIVPIEEWREDDLPRKREIIHNGIIALLCQASIWTVTEPEIRPGITPQQAAVNAFNSFSQTIGPKFMVSPEVREALRPLGGNPEEFLPEEQIRQL